jgi:hypothetical protein
LACRAATAIAVTAFSLGMMRAGKMRIGTIFIAWRSRQIHAQNAEEPTVCIYAEFTLSGNDMGWICFDLRIPGLLTRYLIRIRSVDGDD